jgi:hypothetical protein
VWFLAEIPIWQNRVIPTKPVATWQAAPNPAPLPAKLPPGAQKPEKILVFTEKLSWKAGFLHVLWKRLSINILPTEGRDRIIFGVDQLLGKANVVGKLQEFLDED